MDAPLHARKDCRLKVRAPGVVTSQEAPAAIGFWSILGGCVALLWWVVRKRQRQGRQEYDVHSTTSGADRPATDRQLDYIESLLDSAGITLNDGGPPVASKGSVGQIVIAAFGAIVGAVGTVLLTTPLDGGETPAVMVMKVLPALGVAAGVATIYAARLLTFVGRKVRPWFRTRSTKLRA